MNQPPEVFDRASLFELVTGYNPCRYIRVTRQATATERRKKVLEGERGPQQPLIEAKVL